MYLTSYWRILTSHCWLAAFQTGSCRLPEVSLTTVYTVPEQYTEDGQLQLNGSKPKTCSVNYRKWIAVLEVVIQEVRKVSGKLLHSIFMVA
jgi:hypothetical protein